MESQGKSHGKGRDPSPYLNWSFKPLKPGRTSIAHAAGSLECGRSTSHSMHPRPFPRRMPLPPPPLCPDPPHRHRPPKVGIGKGKKRWEGVRERVSQERWENGGGRGILKWVLDFIFIIFFPFFENSQEYQKTLKNRILQKKIKEKSGIAPCATTDLE